MSTEAKTLTMEERALMYLVDRALMLDRDLAETAAELKKAKLLLVDVALEMEGQKTEGGGLAMTLHGHGGNVARIVFPARKLKDSINPSAQAWEKIRKLLPKSWEHFFSKKTVYQPAERFREIVKADLDPAVARKLIRLCETDSTPSVSFETKEVVS